MLNKHEAVGDGWRRHGIAQEGNHETWIWMLFNHAGELQGRGKADRPEGAGLALARAEGTEFLHEELVRARSGEVLVLGGPGVGVEPSLVACALGQISPVLCQAEVALGSRWVKRHVVTGARRRAWEMRG